MIQFGILGPVEVLDVRGSAVDLGGTRERTLLALLVMSPDRVVSAERLAEDLWGERMPQGAAHALRVSVSRLRRVLRQVDADGLVVTQSPGYVLRVDPEAIDSCRFEALVAQGRAAASAGEHGRAAEFLREGLGLWRGPVLADLVDVPAARSEAARLEEARLVALEERVDADLVCGCHDELVGELEGLTRAYPVRERMWSQRMLALYRAGRQAEALQVFGELRGFLDAELGIEPSRAVTRLHAAVLRQDPELDGRKRAGVPAPPPSGSMPPLLTEMGRVFVGRGVELEALGRMWRDTEVPTPRLTLLAGEPGVGKTRLAAEFAGAVQADEALVLAGRCDEDLGVPYQPFVEALRDYVSRTAPDALAQGLGRWAGELVRLVPEIAERVADLPMPLRADPETERYRLFDAVTAWLAFASGARAVLLVLDDLHWAAKPTLQLLRHVSRSAEARRLVVVGTYRDTELGRTHPLTVLLADLRRQAGVQRIRLTGLDEPAVIAFMERTAGHDLAAADVLLAHAVFSETEGNPFFVREILRHLTETGKIDRRDGRWGARLGLEELGIPDGVREVVGRRLNRLSDETNALLRVAAVVGAEFEFALVAEAGGFAEEALLAALEEAVEARLVIEVAGAELRCRFAHAIVRSTLQEELTGARRAMLHRRVAVAIEHLHTDRLDDQLPALAYHCARAPARSTERERAVDYAARAGRRAVAQLANDEAATYFQQAVELLGPADEGRRVELLIALGEAQRRAGDAGHRQTLLAAAGLARTRGDVDGLARAAIANSPSSKPSVFGITDHERIASLEAALEAVGPGDGPARARLQAILALELFHTGDRRRRLALSDEALAIARRLDDPELLCHVLVARPFAIGGPDTLTQRWADTGELLEVARRQQDPVMTHRAWWSRFRVAVEIGDTAESDRCLAAEQELIADIGQPTLEWMTGLQEVATAFRCGRLPEAETRMQAVHAQGQLAGQQDARLYFAIQLFQLFYEQGRGEVRDVLQDVVAASPELPSIKAALALFHAQQGRTDQARALFDEIAREDFVTMPVEASTMVAFAFCSELCAALHDERRAAQLYELLLPYPEQITVWAVGLGTGSVAHCLGRLAFTLGDFDRSDQHFGDAAVLAERVHAPTWLARARLERARTLLARGHPGDRERAAELLAAATAAAHEFGLAPVAHKATRLRAR